MMTNIRDLARLQQCLLLCLLLLAISISFSHADVGTAAHYSPPYIPTACYGNDESAFPENRVFAAAGEGIWNNGAACGREYLVSCINAPAPSSCVAGTIQVKIVDRASTAKSHASRPGSTLVLSTDAFAQLVNPPSATFFNAEFRELS